MTLNFRFQFLGPFLAGEWAWPQNPIKKLAHVGPLLGHLLSQNRVPKPINQATQAAKDRELNFLHPAQKAGVIPLHH